MLHNAAGPAGRKEPAGSGLFTGPGHGMGKGSRRGCGGVPYLWGTPSRGLASVLITHRPARVNNAVVVMSSC